MQVLQKLHFIAFTDKKKYVFLILKQNIFFFNFCNYPNGEKYEN